VSANTPSQSKIKAFIFWSSLADFLPDATL
jgi:hypothetical protein